MRYQNTYIQMFQFIKKYKIIIISTIVVFVVVVIGLKVTAKGDFTTTAPVVDDLIRIVKVSGKIVPENEVALGFETAGTVAKVYKQVGDKVSRGDILVQLDNSKIVADLSKARADLSSARAELAKIDGDGVYSTKTDNAKGTVVQAIRTAYTNTDDAIRNKVDQFFKDPNTQNPEILFAFEGFDLRDSINEQRIVMGEILNSFKQSADSLTVSSYSNALLNQAKKYLESVSMFLIDVARAVNDFETNNGLTQTTIDKYKADVATARQNVDTALSNLITQGDKLRESLSDVPVQVAKVEAAQANVLSYEFNLAKSTLTSPISGIVSKQDAKVGQTVSLGTAISSVISQTYKIETYVPEVSIAGVAIQNPAIVTLDAYGTDEIFNAIVSAIDPAETVRDGVSTYKVTLMFTSPDARIRSGMTAAIDIETQRKENVLLVPRRAVVHENSVDSVYVLVGSKSSEKIQVVLGEVDSFGNVEVISGVTTADALLINPPKK